MSTIQVVCLVRISLMAALYITVEVLDRRSH